jgi:hypothetical protein
MALGSFPYLIASILGSLADAQNLVAKELPIQIFNVIATIVAVVIGVPFGLLGISVGIAAKSFLLMLLLQNMVARSHVSLTFKHIIEAITPAIMASVAGFLFGGATVYGLSIWRISSVFMNLCIVSTVVFLFYGAVLYSFSRYRPDNESLSATMQIFKDGWVNVRSRLPNRKHPPGIV